jgi:hypothetical protein
VTDGAKHTSFFGIEVNNAFKSLIAQVLRAIFTIHNFLRNLRMDQ